MRRLLNVVLVLGLCVALGMAFAVVLQPGDNVLVTCPNSLVSTVQPNSINSFCATNEPTTVPTDTPVVCPSNDFWHFPACGHEHGDAPPAWVMSSAYPASFTWVGNTPNENLLSFKHSAFKGFSGTLNGVDVYLIAHFDVNPGGHASRFHSFQFWMRDPSGGVSYIAGWMDFGTQNTTQTSPNILHFGCGENTNLRPVIEVNVQVCPDGSKPTQGLSFETWYNAPSGHLGQAGWMPDLGLSSSPTYYDGGDPTNPSTWTPTGGLNLTRRLEVAWYAFRDNHRGVFYSTQFGKIVSGPNDPICGTPYTVGTRTYTQVCIQEFIAPTAQTIQYPGNNFQHTFSPIGINLPN